MMLMLVPVLLLSREPRSASPAESRLTGQCLHELTGGSFLGRSARLSLPEQLVCIISGLRKELLDSSILVAATSRLFESVSGLHGELVLRNSAARSATHRQFGSARAVCRGPPRALFASWDVSIVQPRCFSSTHRARSELRPLVVARSPLARRLLGTRLVWKQNQRTSGVSSHQPYSYQALLGCRRHIQIIPNQLHRTTTAKTPKLTQS
jgi:hypothetical protein